MRVDPQHRRPRYDPRLSEQDIAAIAEVLRPFTMPILSMRVLGPDEVEVRTGYIKDGTCGFGRNVRARRTDGRWVAVARSVWKS